MHIAVVYVIIREHHSLSSRLPYGIGLPRLHLPYSALLDSLEVNLGGWPAAAVVELAQDASESLARVVHRSVALRTSHDNFARLEHQRRRLRLVLVDQPDDLSI